MKIENNLTDYLSCCMIENREGFMILIIQLHLIDQEFWTCQCGAIFMLQNVLTGISIWHVSMCYHLTWENIKDKILGSFMLSFTLREYQGWNLGLIYFRKYVIQETCKNHVRRFHRNTGGIDIGWKFCDWQISLTFNLL